MSKIDVMRAMHNIHIALEESRSIPRGAVGFPATRDPTEWVESRIVELERELVRAVQAARRSEVAREHE